MRKVGRMKSSKGNDGIAAAQKPMEVEERGRGVMIFQRILGSNIKKGEPRKEAYLFLPITYPPTASRVHGRSEEKTRRVKEVCTVIKRGKQKEREGPREKIVR